MRIRKNEDELYRAYKESKGKDFYRLGSSKGKMGSISSKDSQHFIQSDHDYDEKKAKTFTRPLATTIRTPEDIKKAKDYYVSKATSLFNLEYANGSVQKKRSSAQRNDINMNTNAKVVQIVAFLVLLMGALLLVFVLSAQAK